MKEIRPSYYKNRRGHDLFWKMETRGYPYQWCLGFCQINADKYERRAGQIRFHHMLASRHVIHGLAYSVDDAIEIVEKGLIGYGF